jgi:hypothetical protein
MFKLASQRATEGQAMAKQMGRSHVDLSESSVYGDAQTELDGDDVASEDRLERLETITGGADEDPPVFEGEMAQQFDELNAGTEEELDALKVNLMQDDDPFGSRDGSGRVVDDIAEEQIAEFTEVGPMVADRGGVSVAPGNEDTSDELRRHHPQAEMDGYDAVVEGSIDDPLDEDDSDRKVEEGTAA